MPHLDATLPPGLSGEHRDLLLEVGQRTDDTHGPHLLGLVLSGSAGRGIATDLSDLDVYVVLSDQAAGERSVVRSPLVDEMTVTIQDLEEIAPFGSAGWWFRWSFAWAPILLDRTDGRLGAALERQSTVSRGESQDILVRHGRLDGWINYAYWSLKNDRDGHRLERQLDAVESVPWLLDVIFTLAGRVRPYNKYLPWELHEHPLRDWPDGDLLPLLEATLDGDPAAIRATFARIEELCRDRDRADRSPALTSIIEGWGGELDLLHS